MRPGARIRLICWAAVQYDGRRWWARYPGGMLLVPGGGADLEETIVGARAGLRAVVERVDQVAPTAAPVLILGETGSGKEVIARAVHARSKRAAGPLVRVNC